MNVTVAVDLEPFKRGMDDVQLRQLPFALATSLNAVAFASSANKLDPTTAQGAIRALGRETFTLRRQQFFDLSIKQTHKATKREPYATLAVDAPGDRDDVIAKFESDTEKRPHDGGRSLAIPISKRIKRNNAAIVADRDRPSAYNFRNQGKRVVGDRGTFVIRKAMGNGLTGMIFQRVAKGKQRIGPQLPSGFALRGADGRFASAYLGRKRRSDIVALYALKARVPIKPNLHFVRTATRIVDAMWARRFTEAFDQAMRTAR